MAPRSLSQSIAEPQNFALIYFERIFSYFVYWFQPAQTSQLTVFSFKKNQHQLAQTNTSTNQRTGPFTTPYKTNRGTSPHQANFLSFFSPALVRRKILS